MIYLLPDDNNNSADYSSLSAPWMQATMSPMFKTVISQDDAESDDNDDIVMRNSDVGESDNKSHQMNNDNDNDSGDLDVELPIGE